MSIVSYRADLPPKRGVECPECESPRTRARGTGWANDGSIPIRVNRCHDCGRNFVTAEVVIPDSHSLSPFDEIRRRSHREYQRRRHGYHGGGVRGGARDESDRLAISIRIVRKPRRGYVRRGERAMRRGAA